MGDQIDLLEVAPSTLAKPGAASEPTIHPALGEWFRAGRTTPSKHAAAAGRGLHPFGLPLSLWPGATCGNCAHVTPNQMRGGKVFHKCGLDRSSWTAGPGSDLRLRWRGCRRWVPPAEPQRMESETITRADPAGPITRWSLVPAAVNLRPRIAPDVAGTLMEAEAECPSLGWAEVALERWQALVIEGALAPGEAADLLLKGIRAAGGRA